MTNGGIVLMINSEAEHWSSRRWKARFESASAGRPIFVSTDDFDPCGIAYAAVWKPKPGELSKFHNLKAIFNLGAGVDALLSDSTLPDVPIVRVVIDDLTSRMTEYVVLHVLMHHRQDLYLRQCQQQERWAPKNQWSANAISVGIMGLGSLGIDAANALRGLGFKVYGWSRTQKDVPGVKCFFGSDELGPFLRQTNILVCLLPLTADTRNILDRNIFAQLNRHSPLGSPVLINAGRGGLQNENDILESLQNGTLGAASLDVFQAEPLPKESPFWKLKNLIITPHNAADTDVDAISDYVVRQITSFEAGESLKNTVDLNLGY